MKTKVTILLFMAIALVSAVFFVQQKKLNIDTIPEISAASSALGTEDQMVYNLLQEMIDKGDCEGFAEVFLTHNVSDELLLFLMQEDAVLVETVLLDAMLTYADNGQLDRLVLLRKNGFLSDKCFMDYWEVTDAILPDAECDEYDLYLIHELKLAYLRDSYALRTFSEMRDTGVIDDAMHLALVDALGFDYTDQAYIEEHQLAPLQILTPAEKAAYDDIMVFIDEGDCMGVIETMLSDDFTQNLYGMLQKEDSELIDFVVAQGIGFLGEEYRYLDLVRLRVNGFVSDACFEIYWEMIDSRAIDRLYAHGTFYDTDMYLLCELEEIADTFDDGTEVVEQIMHSGLLSSGTYYALAEALGIEITE